MIPRKLEPVLFGFILSGLMSWVVSGVSTLTQSGAGPGFVRLWAGSWLAGWTFAFPIVLLAAPLARRMARGLLHREP